MAIQPTRRDLMKWATGSTLGLAMGATAHAQPSNAKPLRLVVGFGAGSSPDVIARALTRRLEETLGIPIVIDNRPGAGAMLAVANVGASPADGSTLLFGTTAEFTIAPHLYNKLPYDPSRLVPVSELATADLTLVCSTQVPAPTAPEFLKWAQSKTPLLMGTFGPGTAHHLVAVMLGQTTKLKVEPVHYRVPGDSLNDLASGVLPCAIVSSSLAQTWQQAGKVHVLAVSGPQRALQMPSVPTFKEVGLGGAEFAGWVGIFAPPGTRADVVERLGTAFSTAVRHPTVKTAWEGFGYQITGTPHGPFQKVIAEDLSRYGKVVSSIGLKLD